MQFRLAWNSFSESCGMVFRNKNRMFQLFFKFSLIMILISVAGYLLNPDVPSIAQGSWHKYWGLILLSSVLLFMLRLLMQMSFQLQIYRSVMLGHDADRDFFRMIFSLKPLKVVFCFLILGLTVVISGALVFGAYNITPVLGVISGIVFICLFIWLFYRMIFLLIFIALEGRMAIRDAFLITKGYFSAISLTLFLGLLVLLPVFLVIFIIGLGKEMTQAGSEPGILLLIIFELLMFYLSMPMSAALAILYKKISEKSSR